MNESKRKAYLPIIIAAIVILTVSSIPSLSPPSLELAFEDKIAHFAEYAILGGLIGRAIRILGIPQLKNYLYGIGACSLFGIFDELHQAIVPNRTTDVLDMAADILGSVAGIILAAWWYSRKDKSKRTE